MQNKSVEERAMKLYPYPSNATLGPIHRNKLKMKIDNYRAAYIKGRQEEAARQDQGVVGTQGREALLSLLSDLTKGEHPDRSCSLEAQGYNQSECESIAEKDYWAQRAKTVLANLNHWPVSEGEGIKWIKASERLPEISTKDIHLKYKGRPYIGKFQYHYYFNFPFGAVGIDYDQQPRPSDLEDVEWLCEPQNQHP